MFENPLHKPAVLTLSQLAAGIMEVIGEGFPSQLWITAELAKLNHYPGSGHCYPALVEKEKGTVKAEMRGTIWANDFMKINQKFLLVTKEPLKEGIRILFRAVVKYHPVYGLSLQISDIDPTYTLGEMAREKMETIMKLKEEGIFERNRQLQLPLLPKRIAVISVKTSKGFSDFINILENNPWGYAFTCFLFPALLQGDKAVETITGQLRVISRLTENFDAVAIIRGGGGDVGLNCYDSYLLAREVALCPLPVLTGIGHSTNETVTEMVAGYNKITPTDVAYFLLQQFHNYSARLQEFREKIIDFSREMLDGQKSRWAEISKRIRYKPVLMLQQEQIGLRNKTQWLAMRIGQLFTEQESVLDKLGQKVHLLDPVMILKRGYSITYHKGKPLTASSGVRPDEIITTRLFEGEIESEIKSKS